MSILVIEVVVRGLWGVIAVPTLALGRWTQGGSGSGRGKGRNLPPSPAPARSGALLLVLVLGRGRRRWRQGCCMDGEAEWSRVEIPPGCIPTTPTTPATAQVFPILPTAGYCMAAAMLRTWEGKKSMEAGRTMSPSPACLDRHTGTRICRLTTRTRGAIAGIHHEASRLPPPATPLPPPCGSRRRNVRSRDYDCEAGRFLDVFMPGHLVSPLSPIHSTCRGVGEGRGSGKWDGGTHPGGGPAIDQRIQRSAAIVERREKKVPVVSYSPGALRRRRPLEDEGGKGSGTWVGCAARLHMHNAE